MTRTSSPAWIRDRRGAVTPLAAATLAVMLGMGGLVIDLGVWYVQRRNLQGATDAAALAAAHDPAGASAVAADFLARNGYAAADLVSTEAGYYCPDSTLAPAARFSTTPCATGAATPAGPNAVRVRARTTGPAILSRAVNRSLSGADIRTVATAARVDEAGLQIGSGLVSADLPVANAMLQSMLGGSGLNLSAAQFNGLLSTHIDALTYFDALATQLGVAAGTYDQVLSTQARLTDVLDASINALTAQNANQDVSAAIAGMQAIKAKVTGNPTVNLGQLFDLGVWRDEPVGGSGAPAALHAGLNAYQLASFALQLANGSHAVAVPTTSLGVPGLAGVTLQATAIEPPQTAYFAFGPTGLSVHTAQVRAKLTLQAAGIVDLPLYIEVGRGDATLTDLDCGADPAYDAVATVQATTAVASVYLGNVPANAMTNFSTPISPASVTAVPLLPPLGFPLSGVNVLVKSTANVGSSTPTTLTFSQAPASGVPAGTSLSTHGYIARAAYPGGPPATPGWPAEVVSTGALGGVASSLVGNLNVSVPALGVLQGALNLILNPVLVTLGGILGGIDPLVDAVLKGLGVKLGRAEVLVTGVRCGVPVLVG